MSQILPPDVIVTRIRDALDALERRPRTPGLEAYEEDRLRFLRSADELGEPRLLHTEGVPVRYATALFWGDRIGGIVASDPHSGEVLSWPAWAPGPRPLFMYSIEEVERFLERNDPRVGEVVPRELKTPTRFSVDPARVPGAWLLERYEALPFKNQEERYAWVEEVNKSRRMRTRWRHKGGYQEPSFKCLSYAASTVADWWGLMYGVPPEGRYQNFVNGSQEYGVNPRALEVLYYHRARRLARLTRQGRMYRLAPPLPQTLDPVTRERIPACSRAFAHLLTTPEDLELGDPLARDGLPRYGFRAGMWHMDMPPKTLFSKGQADPAAIREALHRHGIVLGFTQARMLRVIRFGLHGVPIVGYFKQGNETLFIYHESYGNHGPGYVWDDSGGPSYMTIPASMLREASCFPHRLWIDVAVEGGNLAVRATHSGGGAVNVRGRTLVPVPERPDRVHLTAGRPYFLREDGQAWEASAPWAGTRPGQVALFRWLLLASQLANHPGHRPAHVEATLAALERELIEVAHRPDEPLEQLSAFQRIVSDREVTLLQSQLLPRLVQAGLSETVVRRVMA
jgi:hypothetical protein